MSAAARVAADPQIDFVVLLQDLPAKESAHRGDVSLAVVDVACKLHEESRKPVVVWGSVWARPDSDLIEPLRSREIPYLTGGEPAIAALAAGSRRAAAVQPRRGRVVEAKAAAPFDRELLLRHSVPMIDESLAADADSAAAAAARFGFTVVMKVASKQIAHKTEVGGVMRGVRQEDVRIAFNEILANASRFAPSATVDGVIVQPEAPTGGLEMAVGVIRDPDWGWIVSCGLGGVLIELVEDTVFAKAPVDSEGAEAMLKNLRCWPLLQGYRGGPARDIRALVDVVVNVSRLIMETSAEVSQFDLNPLLVYPHGRGAIAVDFLVVKHESVPRGPATPARQVR
jgi:acyl-CoA synthetase (NDP forming)